VLGGGQGEHRDLFMKAAVTKKFSRLKREGEIGTKSRNQAMESAANERKGGGAALQAISGLKTAHG